MRCIAILLACTIFTHISYANNYSFNLKTYNSNKQYVNSNYANGGTRWSTSCFGNGGVSGNTFCHSDENLATSSVFQTSVSGSDSIYLSVRQPNFQYFLEGNGFSWYSDNDHHIYRLAINNYSSVSDIDNCYIEHVPLLPSESASGYKFAIKINQTYKYGITHCSFKLSGGDSTIESKFKVSHIGLKSEIPEKFIHKFKRNGTYTFSTQLPMSFNVFISKDKDDIDEEYHSIKLNYIRISYDVNHVFLFESKRPNPITLTLKPWVDRKQQVYFNIRSTIQFQIIPRCVTGEFYDRCKLTNDSGNEVIFTPSIKFPKSDEMTLTPNVPIDVDSSWANFMGYDEEGILYFNFTGYDIAEAARGDTSTKFTGEVIFVMQMYDL